MSNHDGSRLINNLLMLVDDYGFFESLGKEKLSPAFKSVTLPSLSVSIQRPFNK